MADQPGPSEQDYLDAARAVVAKYPEHYRSEFAVTELAASPVHRVTVDSAFAAGWRARVPEGSEAAEEWSMRYNINGKPQCAEDNGHVFDSRAQAEQHIEAWRRFYPDLTYSDVEYLVRDAITTPWCPVEEEA